MADQISLFDDTKTGPRSIPHETARNFIESWHYSGNIPTGLNICYGLYLDDTLYAVIVYGIGVNGYQASFLGVESVIEIKRLARIEPPASYPLSKFISETIKLLRRKMQIDAIVAFADPQHSHHGGVYKASNFVLLGMTQPERHLVDENGNLRHRRFAYRYAKRKNINTPEARRLLNCTPVKTAPKFRWVRYLNKRRQQMLIRAANG